MVNERIKWTYYGGVVSIGFDNTILDTYDLKVLFPKIEEMTEVQRSLIVYGFKQNLSDKIAGMKDYTMTEKVKTMTSRYDFLVKGVWKSLAKEKTSVKKKASELVEAGGLTEVELALLEKLGLK